MTLSPETVYPGDDVICTVTATDVPHGDTGTMDTQVVIDNTAPIWTNEANITSDNDDGAKVGALNVQQRQVILLNLIIPMFGQIKMVLSWVQLQHCYSMQQIPMLMMC